MKKLLLLLLVLPLVFGSCSKDDDDKAPSLRGTSWSAQNGKFELALRFSELECVIEGTAGGDFAASTGYSYTYDHPTIMMIPKDSDNARLKGTVSGDYKTIVLVNSSKDTTVGTFTKK